MIGEDKEWVNEMSSVSIGN